MEVIDHEIPRSRTARDLGHPAQFFPCGFVSQNRADSAPLMRKLWRRPNRNQSGNSCKSGFGSCNKKDSNVFAEQGRQVACAVEHAYDFDSAIARQVEDNVAAKGKASQVS